MVRAAEICPRGGPLMYAVSRSTAAIFTSGSGRSRARERRPTLPTPLVGCTQACAQPEGLETLAGLVSTDVQGSDVSSQIAPLLKT